VSLHGTLETFALPDVLALLAATKKNGELHVVGGTTDGRVWFDEGNVVGAEVGASASLVDAVFELLRLEAGKFSFDADKAAPSPTEPAAIQPLLDEAQSRLTEWRSIEAVVPSTAHGVRLLPEVKEGPVTVTGDEWRALVGVATSPTVQSVIERLGLGEFQTCRTLKGLVEAGLVSVERAAAPAPPPPPAPEPAPEPAPVAEAPKPRIQALTTTPAASAAQLEAEAAPAAPTPTAEPAKPAQAAETEPKPEPPSQGEADELVRQVAALEPSKPAVEPTPAPEPEKAPAAEAGEAAPEAPAAEGEEPINRGLLLKFLSSVRT
jgi:hypothetical protein